MLQVSVGAQLCVNSVDERGNTFDQKENKAYVRFRKIKSGMSFGKYKKCRNELKHGIRRAPRCHEMSLVSYQENPKVF